MSESDKNDAGRGLPWLVLVPAGIVVVVLALHAPVYLRYRRNHAAAAEVKRLGGHCTWERCEPPRPLDLLGKTYAKLYVRLSRVELYGTPVTDAAVAHLKGLTRLQRLDLSCTAVTDAGVRTLKAALPACTINGP